MTRFQELISRNLDHTTIPGEEAELAHLLESHDANMDEFLAYYEIDQLLAVLHTPTSDDSIDTILTQLRSESDPFVEAVAREVQKKAVRPPRDKESLWEYFSHWLERQRAVFRPKFWVATAGLTFGLITGLMIWLFGPIAGNPQLAEIHGNGLFIERAGKPLPTTIGMHLQAGDVLRTPANVTAAISFAPEATSMTLQPGTELVFASVSRSKLFRLRFGNLQASVAHQRPFHPMLIRTAQAEARVLGTRFTLAVTTNATRLDVTEGKVKLTRTSDGETVKVSADHYAVAANGVELADLPKTGQILREIWTNLSGNSWINLITHTNYPDRPDKSGYLTNLVSFEMPSDWADNFGMRLRGYIHPPKTGDYTFWIAAKDDASLWLSPDEDPENRVQMANSQGAASRDWQKEVDQQTTVLPLTAGRMYYFEVLHKAGVGDDHLAVAWQRPGGAREVIPGEDLSPFKPKEHKP